MINDYEVQASCVKTIMFPSLNTYLLINFNKYEGREKPILDVVREIREVSSWGDDEIKDVLFDVEDNFEKTDYKPYMVLISMLENMGFKVHLSICQTAEYVIKAYEDYEKNPEESGYFDHWKGPSHYVSMITKYEKPSYLIVKGNMTEPDKNVYEKVENNFRKFDQFDKYIL